MFGAQAIQLLAQAHIKAVHRIAERTVAAHDTTLGIAQHLVGINNSPECSFRCRFSGGIRAEEEHFARAWRFGDVHQVITADAVTVHVIFIDPAVGLADTTFVEQTQGGFAVTEESLRPIDRTCHAFFDQVGRIGFHFLIGIEGSARIEVRVGH